MGKNVKMEDRPLEVSVDAGMVTITIGVALLAKTCNPDHMDLPPIEITDTHLFQKSLHTALTREEEDGTTVVHEMFDKALRYIVENGEEGLKLEGDESPTDND
jgi:hypothetical protein